MEPSDYFLGGPEITVVEANKAEPPQIADPVIPVAQVFCNLKRSLKASSRLSAGFHGRQQGQAMRRQQPHLEIRIRLWIGGEDLEGTGHVSAALQRHCYVHPDRHRSYSER